MPDPVTAMNRKIIAIGETVLDILFRDGQVLKSCPGGSMLNTAVSLGRAGDPVMLVTDIGSGAPGKMIRAFLEENHVELLQASGGGNTRTAIALAFLDGGGNAQYEFYKETAGDRNLRFDIVPARDDIVLFGSFYGLADEHRSELVRFLELSRSKRALIMYDPNFRRPHMDELDRMKPRIMENISFSDLVRGSDEDFLLIFGARNASESMEHVKSAGCSRMIYTRNRGSIEFITTNHRIEMEVPAINPVSSVGAGDSFNAGLAHSMLKAEVGTGNIDNTSKEKWESILRTGIRFATDVCMNTDNFISPELAKELRSC